MMEGSSNFLQQVHTGNLKAYAAALAVELAERRIKIDPETDRRLVHLVSIALLPLREGPARVQLPRPQSLRGSRDRPLVIPGFAMKLGMFLVRLVPMPILRVLWRLSLRRGRAGEK